MRRSNRNRPLESLALVVARPIRSHIVRVLRLVVVRGPRQSVLEVSADLGLQIFFGSGYLDLESQILLQTVSHRFKLVDPADNRIKRMKQIDFLGSQRR